MAKGPFHRPRISFPSVFLALLWGSWLGLSPAILTLQNFVLLLSLAFLRLSWFWLVSSALLCWVAGYLFLDPVLDKIGEFLLTEPSLGGLWTSAYHMPLVPWTRFYNSMVLGAFVFGLCLIPIWAAGAWKLRRA